MALAAAAGRRGHDAARPGLAARLGRLAPRLLGRLRGRRAPRRARRRRADGHARWPRSRSRSTSPPGGSAKRSFLLAWHFPNRVTWTPEGRPPDDDCIGNYYTTRFADAWDAAEKVAGRACRRSSAATAAFVSRLRGQRPPGRGQGSRPLQPQHAPDPDLLPHAPTAASTASEGCERQRRLLLGLVHPRLELRAGHGLPLRRPRPLACARSSSAHATDDRGPDELPRAPAARAGRQEFGKAAADGQMGCDHEDVPRLAAVRRRRLAAPASGRRSRKALEFCWIPGGWDADRDGVMEGCQHNTMDVEYYGPNPQMELWYLGALRAAEEMAKRDRATRPSPRRAGGSSTSGRGWIDANLWNGEYYEHRVAPPKSADDVAPSLVGWAWAPRTSTKPDYQLGAGLPRRPARRPVHGPRLRPRATSSTRPTSATTLRSILQVQPRGRGSSTTSTTCGRSPWATRPRCSWPSYPKDRPAKPFPYFTEVMTGFEYAAAVGMLYEGDDARAACSVDPRHPRPLRRRASAAPSTRPSAATTTPGPWPAGPAVPALTGFSWDGVDQGHDLRRPGEGTVLLVERRRLGNLPDRGRAAGRPS
ncbi:MAG: non-lysosomal glucosylceramidase [Anaerotruncus sp.]|nr:non-lysosomal glucosylceramidase [Anaerotruncus sp.]